MADVVLLATCVAFNLSKSKNAVICMTFGACIKSFKDGNSRTQRPNAGRSKGNPQSRWLITPTRIVTFV
jgi:hypothetical protein